MNTSKPFDILLVEDNPVDVTMIKRTFEDSDLNFQLHHAEDGEEAIQFIYTHCIDNIRDTSCPDIVILDLNIPKRSGRSVLAAIKQHPATLQIPVVVLSSSEEDKDIYDAYSLHANCYIEKPRKHAEFKAAVESIQQFWTNIAKLPRRMEH